MCVLFYIFCDCFVCGFFFYQSIYITIIPTSPSFTHTHTHLREERPVISVILDAVFIEAADRLGHV